MTAFPDADNPLSKISIAALLDRRYKSVDMTKADSFVPSDSCCTPSTSRRLRNLGGDSSDVLNAEFFQDDGDGIPHPMKFGFFQEQNDAHPMDFEFFNRNENQSRAPSERSQQTRHGHVGDQGGTQGHRRPPLSEEGRKKAESYGLGLLDQAKLAQGEQRQHDGVTYVGDQSISVLMLENGYIYGVDVSAELAK